MTTKGVPGLPVAVIAAGGILVWSGLFNQSLTSALGSLLTGKAPTKGSQATDTAALSGTSATTTTTQVGASAAGAGETSYIAALLSDIGAPNSAANVASMEQWFKQEEPSFPPPNAWNPLNIESGGAGKFAQYSSSTAGASATAALIASGYPAILAQLKTGQGLSGTGPWNAELSTWSGGGYSSV